MSMLHSSLLGMTERTKSRVICTRGDDRKGSIPADETISIQPTTGKAKAETVAEVKTAASTKAAAEETTERGSSSRESGGGSKR